MRFHVLASLFVFVYACWCPTHFLVACPWSVVLSGTPDSSTTKAGRHEILLKVALIQMRSTNTVLCCVFLDSCVQYVGNFSVLSI
jgi:hypothetical protein